MSFLDKFKLSRTQETPKSFPKIPSQQGTYLAYSLMYDIINTTLSKLTNPDLFNRAIGNGLQEAMVSLFTLQKFKGNLFFRGNELIAVTQGDITDDRLKDFRKVEIDITNNNHITMFSILQELGCHMDNILSNENTNLALAGTTIFYMDEFRTRVSSDISKDVFDSSLKALDDSKESNLLIIDSKDKLSMMGTDLSTNNKISLDFAQGQLVKATGFPLSYFTGVFENGLGSTSENEKAMYNGALERIFLLYFKKFYMYIDDSIVIEKDIALLIAGAKDVIALVQADPDIDKVEIYRRMGIPLKTNYSQMRKNKEKKDG